MKIQIATPPDFNYKRTVMSHGWCQLKPFELDESTWTMKRVFDLGGRQPLVGTIIGTNRKLVVNLSRNNLSDAARRKLIRDVRHVFRLDDDMSEFYSAMSANPDFAWIAKSGAGRMLRSPTVYEDLVKTICTTNCSWGLTTKMVSGLTSALGKPSGNGMRSFPTAEVMAMAPATFYRDEMRAGYRAPYFKELADRVASGEVDVEAWMHSHLPTDELKREMKNVKGVGDYAAENLLKLVGRYDGLALDSWLRSQFAKTHNNGRACKDKKIARHYARFNSWKGLALWCDMTRSWIAESDE